MKRNLLTILLLITIGFTYGQSTYYWVGGAAPVSIHTTSNWNTALDGSGTTRGSATNGLDVLVFDGSNIGGAAAATGLVTAPVNGTFTCGQLKFVNGARVYIDRTGGGTGTITISGDAIASTEDFIVESGCDVSVRGTNGSVRIAMAAANKGRVSGNFGMMTPSQARIDNTISGTAGSFRFTSGSSFTTAITGSSAYAFGSSTQSSEKWVVFEGGSHLYYDGGNSPMGSGAQFSAIDMKPGSTWHHRATNGTSNVGNFFNRKFFGDVIVENNASLIALGPIYGIGNLTINSGCSFTTFASGQTVILGDMVANGNLTTITGGTNEIVFGGSSQQNISGSGNISIATLIIADNANVSMGKDISVERSALLYGKLNFGIYRLTGSGSFTANEPSSITTTGNPLAGSYAIAGAAGFANNSRGLAISGTGIAANTNIVSVSATNDTIFLSKPIVSAGTGVQLAIESHGSTLQTANTNGFDPANGSVTLTGNQIYEDNLNYILDAATSWPFGISTGSSSTDINAGFIEVNAVVTANKSMHVSNHLTLNGKLNLRSQDKVHILTGGVINGSFSNANYIALQADAVAPAQSMVQYDGLATQTTIPIGTANNYLPVTITPSSTADFTATVYEAITANGLINGAPLSATRKQRVVNAVWQINQLTGSATHDLQFGWPTNLEGSTFTTFPDAEIGIISNNGTTWSLPFGVADNTANTASATASNLGNFSIGIVPPAQPFIFNPLPVKTYGDIDFNGGASSLSEEPIVYTSSNPAIATIVNGNIHITGAGNVDITASQASDGFFPAASVTQPLTINKTTLTITADSKSKFEAQPNPALTASYNGFVYGETVAALLTQAVITTTATAASSPGTYPITVSGATSGNYDISFVNSVMTVLPKQNQVITFNAPATKTYGNADFSANANSTNTTIPITYTSSNTAVATISATGLIHIVGAGTATLTASQAGNTFYFPAPDVVRTLTVNKAPLVIGVRDTTKTEGQQNPPFIMTAGGFVLGESISVLSPLPVVVTPANAASPAGYYTLTPQGAVSTNYAIIYTTGRLTIYPQGGTDQQHLHAFMSSSTTLTVRVYSSKPALSDIVLFDLLGRPVMRKNIFIPQGFSNTYLSVVTLPPGIYVVTVRGSGVDLKKTVPIIK